MFMGKSAGNPCFTPNLLFSAPDFVVARCKHETGIHSTKSLAHIGNF